MIMTGLHSEVHHIMIEGIYDQSAALGYDVYLYSLYENPSMGALSQRGAENILTLIQPDLFDGFLVQKGGFQDANIRKQIDAYAVIPDTDFYFMQQFKKETGVTTLEFRKQNQ